MLWNIRPKRLIIGQKCGLWADENLTSSWGHGMIKVFSRSVDSSYAKLYGILGEILANQRKILAMGDFTTLNSAVTALTAAVAANTVAVTDVTAVVGALKSGTDQAQVDAVTAAVTPVIAQVTANNAALEALKPVIVASS